MHTTAAAAFEMLTLPQYPSPRIRDSILCSAMFRVSDDTSKQSSAEIRTIRL